MTDTLCIKKYRAPKFTMSLLLFTLSQVLNDVNNVCMYFSIAEVVGHYVWAADPAALVIL